jgi:hypothetical protein
MEKLSSNFWALAFLYLICLVLLVFAVETKPEAAVGKRSSECPSSSGMALQRVDYSMESLPYGKVELKTRISTSLAANILEDAGPSNLRLQQPKYALQRPFPENSGVVDGTTGPSVQVATVVPISKKFYAVLRGRQPGIYFNWLDCKR